ncbi:MAG: hypothetical protein ACFFER_19170 [Candidatus Thorarchaeota archaeon]
MTRCKAFYRKVKELDSIEEIMEFCGKKDNAVYKIKAHIEYMDRHFPGWDQEEQCTIVQIPEGATRLLRHLERKSPDIHSTVLEDIRGLDSPVTKKGIGEIIREKIFEHRTSDERTTSANIGLARRQIEYVKNDAELMEQLKKHADAPALKNLKYLKIDRYLNISFNEPALEDTQTSHHIAGEAGGLKQWLYNLTDKGIQEVIERDYRLKIGRVNSQIDSLKYRVAYLIHLIENIDDPYYSDRAPTSQRYESFIKEEHSIEGFKKDLEEVCQDALKLYQALIQERTAINCEFEKSTDCENCIVHCQEVGE